MVFLWEFTVMFFLQVKQFIVFLPLSWKLCAKHYTGRVMYLTLNVCVSLTYFSKWQPHSGVAWWLEQFQSSYLVPMTSSRWRGEPVSFCFCQEEHHRFPFKSHCPESGPTPTLSQSLARGMGWPWSVQANHTAPEAHALQSKDGDMQQRVFC